MGRELKYTSHGWLLFLFGQPACITSSKGRSCLISCSMLSNSIWQVQIPPSTTGMTVRSTFMMLFSMSFLLCCYTFWDFIKFDLFSLFLISVFKFSRFQWYLPFFIFTHFHSFSVHCHFLTHLHFHFHFLTHLHSFTLIYTQMSVNLHSFSLLVKRGNTYCTHNNDRSVTHIIQNF